MKMNSRRIRIVSLLMIVVMMLSSISVSAASKKPYASGCNYPKTLTEGKKFVIKGKVKSSKVIKKVEVGVTDSKGKWTKQKYTKTLKKKSFNVKNADKYIKFGKLGAGTYYYKIKAKTASGKTTVLSKKFTVKKKTATATAATGPADSAYATPKFPATNTSPAPQKTIGSTSVENGAVTLKNYNVPSKYTVGRTFSTKGTISSKEEIQRVEIGIVYAPTNKWTTYKYDKKNINSKSFNIADAASKLKFNSLPGGKFRYRIYVHTAGGAKVALNHYFEVTPSKRPQAAVDWALKLAADNRFSYGKKPKTSKVGCYFCGTNKKRKPKGYERTYVCMTFAHAAFAHGAGDAELMRDCKKGNTCLSLTNANFSDYTCWFKVGYSKDLKEEDLLPGDVICYYATDNNSGHLAIYAGNGNIVDAQGIADCWGPNSIAVRKNKVNSYLKGSARFSSKSYVMRYCK